MKILVVQLARLGDIFQTLPTLSALRRENPTAEIHIVLRKKFSAALPKEATVDRVWILDSQEILSPLIADQPDADAAVEKLHALTSQLAEEKFDRVINLSFSPLSSYLTYEVASVKSQTSGYTRFSDGFLSIADDASAYFYAQVGAGPGNVLLSENANRVHVIDLFALVAEVTLQSQDLTLLTSNPPRKKTDRDAIVVHIGASNEAKTLSWPKWLRVVKGLLENYPGQLILIGGADERETAEKVANVSGPREVVNMVGKTTIEGVVEIIRDARLLIGADSAPVQIATLTSTPVLNLSLPIVALYETGPRSDGSRVIRVSDESAIASDDIVREALATISEAPPVSPLTTPIHFENLHVDSSQDQTKVFEWQLLQAVYMGAEFPQAESPLFLHAMLRLSEINTLALEQFPRVRISTTRNVAMNILNQVDALMEQVVNMVGECGVLVRWFRTERIRLGPMPLPELINRTEALHRKFHAVLGYYVPIENEPNASEPNASELMATATNREKGEANDNSCLG